MWLKRNLFPYFSWYQHSHSDSWWTLPYGHSFLFEYYLMHATCWCEAFIYAEYYKCFLALINRLLSPHSFGNLSVCTSLMTTSPKWFSRFIISNPSSADSNRWRTCVTIGTMRCFLMNSVVSSKSLWESGWTSGGSNCTATEGGMRRLLIHIDHTPDFCFCSVWSYSLWP